MIIIIIKKIGHVLTSSVSIVILSSIGVSMSISSFTHWRDGRGSPFTSAGMSMADPFFTMMALLLKNFRIVITGATVTQGTFCQLSSSGYRLVLQV